jgi:hypothetical protein
LIRKRSKQQQFHLAMHQIALLAVFDRARQRLHDEARGFAQQVARATRRSRTRDSGETRYDLHLVPRHQRAGSLGRELPIRTSGEPTAARADTCYEFVLNLYREVLRPLATAVRDGAL